MAVYRAFAKVKFRRHASRPDSHTKKGSSREREEREFSAEKILRKEDTVMNYEKPTIVLVASAPVAIQGSGKNDDELDTGIPTDSAYQADE
jgi:hypothetical protein